MRATRFTHVSIHAYDMDASLRFYTEVFGMRRVPSPDFEHRVEWLQVGDQQLHLFLRDTAAPEFHHFGLDVDDFEEAYRVACAQGLLDADAWSPDVRELNDGSVQMYLRDPAGNLVEVDWPDVTTLDRAVVPGIRRLDEERRQSPKARAASLYLSV